MQENQAAILLAQMDEAFEAALSADDTHLQSCLEQANLLFVSVGKALGGEVMATINQKFSSRSYTEAELGNLPHIHEAIEKGIHQLVKESPCVVDYLIENAEKYTTLHGILCEVVAATNDVKFIRSKDMALALLVRMRQLGKAHELKDYLENSNLEWFLFLNPREQEYPINEHLNLLRLKSAISSVFYLEDSVIPGNSVMPDDNVIFVRPRALSVASVDDPLTDQEMVCQEMRRVVFLFTTYGEKPSLFFDPEADNLVKSIQIWMDTPEFEPQHVNIVIALLKAICEFYDGPRDNVSLASSPDVMPVLQHGLFAEESGAVMEAVGQKLSWLRLSALLKLLPDMVQQNKVDIAIQPSDLQNLLNKGPAAISELIQGVTQACASMRPSFP